MAKTLNSYIDESPLADFEKDELKEALAGLTEEESAVLCERFEEDPWFVPYLYVNFAAKRYALSKGDAEALRQVIEKEEKIAEEIKTSRS